MESPRAQIVAAAEALIQGRILVLGRTYTPWEIGWLCLNKLAHSDRSELVWLAGMSSCGPTWLGAVSYLASEICIETGSTEALLVLQRRRFIPLELDVLSGNELIDSPLRLIVMVRRILDEEVRKRFGEYDRYRQRPERPGTRT